MKPKSLSEKTFGAGSWVIANRLITRVIDFFTLIVLARILEPADFGLVAIAMTFIMIIESVLDLPLAQILVREDKLTDDMFDTAFTLGVIRGLIVTLIVASLAWPIVKFYGDERLFGLMIFVSLAPTFRGMVNPRMAIFMKNLDFRQDFFMNVIAKFASLIISVAIALLYQSYWAIAVATVTTPIVMVLVSYVYCPKLMRFSLLDWPIFKNTVSWFTASRVVSAINWQLDRILLGRYINPAAFGGYSVATNIAALPIQVFLQPLSQPIMSGFVPLKENNEALANAYCKATNAIFFITAPFFLLLAILAEPSIRIVFGEKWIGSSNVLMWLSLLGLFPVVTALFQPLLMVLDKTKFIVVAMACELVVRIPSMILGVLYYGIEGAILAHGISLFVMMISAMFIIKNIIDLGIKRQLVCFWRPILSLLVMYIYLEQANNLLYEEVVGFKYIVLFILIVMSSFITYLFSILLLWNIAGKPEGVEAMFIERVKSFIYKTEGL